VKREHARLVAAAGRVQEDLRRTTAQPWVCSLSADYVLTLTDGVMIRRLVLESEVEDEDWFVNAGTADAGAGLDADADELLAYEVAEAMTDLGFEWPVCQEHRRAMGSCSGWWYCEGESSESYHDIAEVGSLSAG